MNERAWMGTLCVIALAACDGGALPDDAAVAPDSGRAAQDAARAHAGRDGSAADVPRIDWVPFFHEDFEAYENGTPLSGVVFDAAGRTTASTERAHSGKTSARMEIRTGDPGGGFGQWGGIVPIDRVPVGGEIWVRLWVEWPADFDFTNLTSGWMKFLRLHDARGNCDHVGYHDLLVESAGDPSSYFYGKEASDDPYTTIESAPLPRDRFERYELYVAVDDRTPSEGGTARVRVWRDDELIMERDDVHTVEFADDVIDAFYLFTYWNNEEDIPNNHCFVDDLTIATSESPPPNLDAAGNVWIGRWPEE